MSEANVSALPQAGMITLRGDLADAAFGAAVEAAAGCALPGQRGITLDGDRALAWMSPDELLLMVPLGDVPAALATLSERLAGSHYMATDVSDARARFRVSGPGARAVIAKGAPVDMSTVAFPAGQIRRSRLGQVAAAFWVATEAGDAIDLVCFRSVADYVEDWLNTAARAGSIPDILS